MLKASCQVFQRLRLGGKSKELQKCNSKQSAPGGRNCLKDMQIYTDPSRTKSVRSRKFCSLKSLDHDHLHLLSLQKSGRSCPFKTCHRVGTAIPMRCGWTSRDCRYFGRRSELFSHLCLPPVFISNVQPGYEGGEGNLSFPGGLRTGLQRVSLKGNLPKCVDVRDGTD